jgi:predicted ATPase
LCVKEGEEPAPQDILSENPVLSEDDLLSAVTPKTVSLSSIKDVCGVNAIAENQCLDFLPCGLTVVYGNNGAGKSGYIRILKKACRARDRGGAILPNVFSTEITDPGALVSYSYDGETKNFDWSIDAVSPPELAQVSIFDSNCAVIHVQREVDVAFTPSGLDVFPKLSELCRSLHSRLDSERSELLSRSFSKTYAVEIGQNGVIENVLKKVLSNSDVEESVQLLPLNDWERTRLEELRRLERENPEHKAQQALRIQRALGRMQSRAVRIENDLCGEGHKATIEEAKLIVSLSEAAKASALSQFAEMPLSGIGTDAWLELWESARRFSVNHAYRDEEFPRVRGEARCVLCLQSLSDEARGRFETFEEFVKRDTQERLAQARRALLAKKTRIDQLPVESEEDTEFLAELEGDHPELTSSLREFLASAKARREELVETCKLSLEVGVFATPPSALSNSISLNLKDASDALGKRAEQWRKLPSTEEQQKVQEERAILEARVWLQDRVAAVRAESVRIKELASLEAAIRRTDTSAITKMSTSLANEVVTEPMKKTFLANLQAIGFTNPALDLVETRGQYGAQRYQIRFKDAPEQGVVQILSEGEHRCIAIAAFLSELATSEATSGIVLDDPVSSLDHRWRRRVARLLAKTAQDRQVIIFTHDVVFLIMLEKEARFNSLPISIEEIQRKPSGDQSGIATGRKPWVAMTVKERIGSLRDELQRAEKISRVGSAEEYEVQAKWFFGRLRETWERAVEELLLNKVVQRYGEEVQTQRLRCLDDVTSDDIGFIDSVMSECSCYLPGHDGAPAVNETTPSPNELKASLNKLDAWAQDMRRRGRN